MVITHHGILFNRSSVLVGRVAKQKPTSPLEHEKLQATQLAKTVDPKK